MRRFAQGLGGHHGDTNTLLPTSSAGRSDDLRLNSPSTRFCPLISFRLMSSQPWRRIVVPDQAGQKSHWDGRGACQGEAESSRGEAAALVRLKNSPGSAAGCPLLNNPAQKLAGSQITPSSRAGLACVCASAVTFWAFPRRDRGPEGTLQLLQPTPDGGSFRTLPCLWLACGSCQGVWEAETSHVPCLV